MLKQLFVLFNLISFIIVTALLPEGIKIETALPEGNQFVRDSAYIIEVTITKGNIFGFAKFQQDLPNGFDAQPVETSDASFTYADGKVKFIWMAIPERSEVKVSYALTPNRDAPVEGLLEGKFSYIEENERKSYDCPNIPIKVIEESESVEPVLPAVAHATRSVNHIGNYIYEVRLTVTKQGVEGFAKLEEYLPQGVEAVSTETNKSVFSQVNNRAKFVWMAIPKNETIEVMYSVKADKNVDQALKAMEGNFSYLDNNETKTVPVSTELPVETPPVADAEEPKDETPEMAQVEEPTQEIVPAPEPKPEPKPTPVQEQVEPKEVAVVEPEPEPKPKPKPVTPKPEPKPQPEKQRNEQMADNTTKIPNPNTGITYRVQVAAGKKVVTEQFLRKTYSFQEPYSVENHEGWVKYITGGFDVYKGARDKREALNREGHDFPGPFVTAYNSGERITVQEALMITNQQWFK